MNKESYDAVIIGAGISGLVCGCYLAKAGMKVLICEQHYKPGGYCTSFTRKGFTFDAAAHSFGGYRKDGIVRKVFTELGIDKQLRIKRYNPSDTIITPEHKISFWSDLDKTIKDFQRAFPDESDSIKNLFYFLVNPDPTYSIRIRNWTFKNLLDKYFKDEKLKAILSFPLFGNGGLPPSLMSAFTGTQIFTEFLLDGGYYPDGGMQILPDALVDKFEEYGGELRLSCCVKKIKVRNNKVEGIVIEKDGFLPSNYVISNCDARQTFFNLLEGEVVSKTLLEKLNNMTPSLSMFILYLGIDQYFDTLPKPCSTVWYLPHYDIDNIYLKAKSRNIDDLTKYLLRILPGEKSILAMANTSFKSKQYWENNKYKLIETFINIIERSTIPDLSKHIVYQDAATPHTLYRYTLNYAGAAYGWESTLQQFGDSDLRKPHIRNFYLTGHWTTYGQGVPLVVYMGCDTAKQILRKKQNEKDNIIRCDVIKRNNYIYG